MTVDGLTDGLVDAARATRCTVEITKPRRGPGRALRCCDVVSPLPWISGLFLVGVLAGRADGFVTVVTIAIVAAALGAWRSRFVPAGLALGGAALAAGLALGAGVPSLVPRSRAESSSGLLRGEVIEGCRTQDGGAWCMVRRDGDDTVVLRVDGGCSARAGDRIEAVATFETIAPEVNGARAGSGSAWARRGITTRARAAACEVHRDFTDVRAYPRRVGQSLRLLLERGIGTTGDANAARARALLFGDGSGLDQDLQSEFRASGLAHLLAVSGAHVALLAGVLSALVRFGARRVRAIAARGRVELVAATVVLPALVAFVIATGESPSSLRALVGAVLGMACRLAGRRARAEYIVAASAMGMATVGPANVFDPGWQLSVVAAWALSAAPREPFDPEARAPTLVASLRAFFAEALRATVRVAVATAPILAWHFQRVPFLALLANTVAAPLAETLALPAVLATGVLGAIWPRGGTLLGALTAPLLDVLFALPRAALALPGAVIEAPTPTPAQATVLVAAALLAMRARWRVRGWLALVTVIALAGLETVHRREVRPRGVLRITALDVGQGDALLVDLPDGEAMLIDAGGTAGPSVANADPGERIVVPFLADRRRQRLAVVVASHPHPDHVGGLAAVLRWAHVGTLWDTRQGEKLTPGGVYTRMRSEAARRGIPVVGPESLCGPARSFHGAMIRVLAPCGVVDAATPPNDASFVIRISYGDASALLPGDLERAGEAGLLGAIGPVTLLKLGHHGSRTSTTGPWLDELRPRLGIYSAGHPSRFGHPHVETLDALAARNIPAYGTDLLGAVSVTLYANGTYRVDSAQSLDDAP